MTKAVASDVLPDMLNHLSERSLTNLASRPVRLSARAEKVASSASDGQMMLVIAPVEGKHGKLDATTHGSFKKYLRSYTYHNHNINVHIRIVNNLPLNIQLSGPPKPCG